MPENSMKRLSVNDLMKLKKKQLKKLKEVENAAEAQALVERRDSIRFQRVKAFELNPASSAKSPMMSTLSATTRLQRGSVRYVYVQ